MKRLRSMCTLASVYVGTVIGAGFASGQEIHQFFGKHGKVGMLGVFFSTWMLIVIATRVLQTVYKQQIKSFEALGKRALNKTSFKFINLLVAFLLLVGYFVMLAGSGAIVKEHFQSPKIYGILFMSLFCFVVFSFGIEGVAKANNIIVPVLLAVVVFVSISVLMANGFLVNGLYKDILFSFKDVENLSLKAESKEVFLFHWKWMWSAALYTAHNSIGGIIVMTSLLPYIHDGKAAKLGGFLGGVGLGSVALLILLCLLTLQTDIIGLEVPMVAVAHSIGETYKQIYSSILLLAMFTTAIANGFGCILRFSYILGLKEVWARILVCLISIPLATLGFKNLVSFFYPLFGYVGFLFIGIFVIGINKNKP